MSYRLTLEEFNALRDKTGADINKTRRNPVESKAKAQLELIFLSMKLDVVREYKFHEKRKWRFDYALPKLKPPVAIEYEGLPLRVTKSRHTTIHGFCNDCEKYSEAAIMGWCVVRVNALSLESGVAHDLIRRAVDSRRIELRKTRRKHERKVGRSI